MKTYYKSHLDKLYEVKVGVGYLKKENADHVSLFQTLMINLKVARMEVLLTEGRGFE